MAEGRKEKSRLLLHAVASGGRSVAQPFTAWKLNTVIQLVDVSTSLRHPVDRPAAVRLMGELMFTSL